jgi:tetratricopeptide (TPR) repeat protein
MQTSEPPDRINERLTHRVPEALEAVVMKMLEKHSDRRPQNMAEVEALLLEAQIEARLRTPWDDLPLPPVAPERAARISRRLRSSARRLVVFATVATAAVLSALVSAFFAARPAVISQEPVPVRPIIEPRAAEPTPPPKPSPMVPVATSQQQVAPPPTAAAGRDEPAPTPRSAGRVRTHEDPVPAEKGDRPRDPSASREAALRGRAALEAGAYEQARTDFERAIALDQRNVVALAGLAAVQFERAKYEEAAYFAARAARGLPKSTSNFMVLGKASFRLARYSDALRAYERVKALDPTNEEVEALLSKVRRLLGQPGM